MTDVAPRALDTDTIATLEADVAAAKERGWTQADLKEWFGGHGITLTDYATARRGETLPDALAGQLAMISVLGLPDRPREEAAAEPVLEDEYGDLPAALKAAKRWMLWRSEPNADPTKKPRKVPYYADGSPRRGTLDGPEDHARLTDFATALRGLSRGFTGLGFALGPDEFGGHWQGIDLDNVADHPGLEFIADDLPGYTERSPSGTGVHALGYGRRFNSLGSNTTGIEAYAYGRYFTVTGESTGAGDLTCLAQFVEERLAPVHSPRLQEGTSTAERPAQERPGTILGALAVRDLRSALAAMRADDRHLWVRMGHALKDLGEQGRGLWIEWSQTSDLYDAADAAAKWETFNPQRTGYQAVFAEAQRQGWVNPGRSSGATPSRSAPQETHFAPNTAEVFEAPQSFLDPWERYIVPSFPLDTLPTFLRRFVEQQAMSIGADVSGLAMAAVVAASAAISHDFRLKMKRTGSWHVRPRLWTVLVGDPSDKKSPIVNAVCEPLHERDVRNAQEHARRLAAWEEAVEAKEAKKSDEPSRPPRHVVQDVTAEKLSEILSRSDRGLLVQRDELAGWIGSMEQYKGKGGAGSADRAHWLKAYDGGRYTVDRVKGELVLSNFSVSFIGAVQPERLAQMAGLTSDGLLQRFLPVMLASASLSDEVETEATEAEYSRVINYLASYPGSRILTDSGAQEVVRELEVSLHELVRHGGFTPAMQGFLGKLEGVHGSLMLVLHLLADPEFGPTTAVGAPTARAAKRIIEEFVIPHAVEFYRSIEDKSDSETTRSIASYILTCDRDRIRASDFTANVHALRGLGLWDLQRRLSLMVVGGWLRPEDNLPTCRSWLVEDGVREAFTARAAAEKARRDEVRDKLNRMRGGRREAA